MRRTLTPALLILAMLAPAAAEAENPGARANVPRFVSLDSVPARLREGPSQNDQVRFVYERAHLPLEVIAEHGHWRRIRDPLGTVGWMHRSLLSNTRMVMVTGEGNAALYEAPDAASGVRAFAQPGVIAALEDCAGSFCEIRVRGLTGHVARARLWGVRPGDGPP